MNFHLAVHRTGGGRGTSDATSLSSLIVSLIMISLTFFSPQNPPYSSFEDNMGRTEEWADGRTDGNDLL